MAKARAQEEANNQWLRIVDGINQGNYAEQLRALKKPFDPDMHGRLGHDPAPKLYSQDIDGNTVWHKLCMLLVNIYGSNHEAEEFRAGIVRSIKFWHERPDSLTKNNIGQTILHILAAAPVEEKIILPAIDKVIQQYALNDPDNAGRTAIDYAVTTGKIGLAQKLVENGGNISDPRIIIDASEAAAAGSEPVKISALQFLRNKGDDASGALCDELLATQVSHEKARQEAKLLECVAFVNKHSLEKYKDIIKDLVEHGTSVNAQDAKGRTALHMVFHPLSTNDADAHMEMAQFLLSLKADPNLPDHEGSTLLHVLANLDSRDYQKYNDHIIAIAQILIDRGANTEIKNAYFATPLMQAVATTEAIGLAQCLVESGADIETSTGRDSKCLTAAEVLVYNIREAEEYLSRFPSVNAERRAKMENYIKSAQEVLRAGDGKTFERTMLAFEEATSQHLDASAAVAPTGVAEVLIEDDLS